MLAVRPRERRPPGAVSAPEEGLCGCVTVTAMASAAVLLRVGLEDLGGAAGRVGQDGLRVLAAEDGCVEGLLELRDGIADAGDRRREVQVVDLRGERRLVLQGLELRRLAHRVASRHLTTLGPLDALGADPVEEDACSGLLVLVGRAR